MSHPEAISRRCNRKISRIRRRILLRVTATPSAFFTLIPNRLMTLPLGRKKTTNDELERRRPSRYTASKSARRKSRLARGKSRLTRSDACEAMASLFAASRQDLLATLALHACAEAVFLVTAAHMGLKGTFRQRSLLSPLQRMIVNQ